MDVRIGLTVVTHITSHESLNFSIIRSVINFSADAF